MCMNVRGGIRELQKQRSQKTFYTDDAGRPLSKPEAIDALMDELAQGHELMPMNPKCGNPCENSPLCKGFDYGKGGGCPGYALEEVRPATACTCLTGQLGPDYCEVHAA
jgi:hypothetical protein